LNIKYKSHETKQCSHSGMYICAWVICSRSDTSDFYFPYSQCKSNYAIFYINFTQKFVVIRR
jgi:hypothetical protein